MSTSLISDLLNIQPQTSTPAGSMQVKMLPCEYIMRNPDNKIYVVGDIDKLKEDIRLNGVRQPLEVIRWANGYKLIGGERRLTACEELAKEGDDRFSSLPCIIVESKGEVDDRIALITANATARDLTDGERLAQYEALKNALTRKKREGHLEGKVRDEVCRILGLSTGAAARLNAISENCDEETKQFLHDGEISLMDAYRNAQNNIEKRRQAEEKAKDPVTVSEGPENFPSALSLGAATAAEKPPVAYQTAPEEQSRGMAVENAASTPEHPANVITKSPATSNTSVLSGPRGLNMLIKLAQKTLDETASWALYLCEVKFRVEYYTQPLPGGATLWMRLDEIAKEKKRERYADYAIILQNDSFFTDGWENRQRILDDLVRWFSLT